MSASLGVLVTSDEKSVVRTDVESRTVATLRALRTASAASARPTEYGSWKSISTTFLTFSLSTMNRASLGPWMKSPGTTRKKPGVPSRGVPFVSDVRVADGEM